MSADRFTFTIEVYTDALTISGSYDLPLYRRVSDAINSRMHRFIALRDAAVAPLGRPQHAQRVPQILVDWSDALLVATLAEPDPPPGFSVPAPPRDTQPMMFFTSTFALRADFYKRTDMQLVEMFGEMTDDFLALRNVNLYPHQGGQPISRAFVCLNRHRIQAMYAVGSAIAHGPVPASLDPAPAPPRFVPPIIPEPEPPAPEDPSTDATTEVAAEPQE
ncbi:MAG: hypothetical protein AB4911_06120 [Oscillochloridaceae bacterium umkhey_bin13]